MLIRFFCSFFSSKNFCEHSERWPPLSEMKLFMGEAGKSCVEVCKMTGELNNVYCNSIRVCFTLEGGDRGPGDRWNRGWEGEEKGRRLKF